MLSSISLIQSCKKNIARLTVRHDVMHGYRQEEDGVAVVSSRTRTEMLLHGLHDGEQLLCELHHIVEDDLGRNIKKKQSTVINNLPQQDGTHKTTSRE